MKRLNFIFICSKFKFILSLAIAILFNNINAQNAKIFSINAPIFKRGDTMVISGSNIKTFSFRAYASFDSFSISNFIDKTQIAGTTDTNYSFIVPNFVLNEIYKINGFNYINQQSDSQKLVRFFVIPIYTDSVFVLGWGYNYYGQLNFPSPMVNIIEVATGQNHSLALKTDGTVIAWGNNPSGQTNVPADLSKVVSISAGGFHSLALKSDGSVICWGNNDYNQVTVPEGLADVVAIAAGTYHSVALKSDGTLVVWGAGKSNTGIEPNYGQSIVPNDLNKIVSISAGSYHTMALKTNGNVIAWGRNNDQQIDIPIGLNSVVAIEAGASHSVALKSDSTVVAWGNNTYGQTEVPNGLNKVVLIRAGNLHSLALKSDKTIVAWGNDAFGQTTISRSLKDPVNIFSSSQANYNIGLFLLSVQTSSTGGGSISPSTFVKKGDSLKITFMPSTGYYIDSVIVNGQNLENYRDSTQFTFKNINNSQFIKIVFSELNTIRLRNILYPIVKIRDSLIIQGRLIEKISLKNLTDSIELPYIKKVKQQGADSLYYFVIPQNITPANYIVQGRNSNDQSQNNFIIKIYNINYEGLSYFGWGDNDYNQLNIPNTLRNIVSIAVGGKHSLALKSDGTVVAWGNNDYGQTTIPLNLNSVVAISAGDFFSIALKSDGTVVAWGDNENGQLAVPTGFNNFLAVAAGGKHSLALKSDGTVVAWGAGTTNTELNSNYGQSIVPYDLNNVVAIAGGEFHSLALKSDSTVVAWGWNQFYQTSVPSNLNSVVAIAAGSLHSLALKSDSTFVAWGFNDYGQTPSPTGLNKIVAIAGGENHSLALTAEGNIMAFGDNSKGQSTIPNKLKNVVHIYSGSSANYNFAINKLAVETSATNGGTISSTSIVQYGDSLRIEFSPNQGFYIDSVIINDSNYQSYRDSNHYDFKNITQNQTISVYFSGVPILNNISNSIRKIGDTLIVEGRLLNNIQLNNLRDKIELKNFKTEIKAGNDSFYYFIIPNIIKSGIYILNGINQGFLSTHNFLLKICNVQKNFDSLGLIGWGDSTYNQLDIPVGLRNVVSIASGRYHTIALKSDGTVVGWGGNHVNQINIPDDLNSVVDIAAGEYYSLALKSDGTLVDWGWNGYGVVLPAGLDSVIAIAVGGRHVLALKSTGKVVAWGDNGLGQATPPQNLDKVLAISAGYYHSLALKTNGKIVVWGDTNYGLTRVPDNLDSVVAITSGEFHSLALKSDSTVVAWGENNRGQDTVPTNLNKVQTITSGAGHNLALINNGNVIGWGNNSYGETNLPYNLFNVEDMYSGFISFKSFAIYRLSVLTSANIGGIISPTTFVKYGDTLKVNYSPLPGFIVDSVIINDSNYTSFRDSTHFIFNNITQNQLIKVYFGNTPKLKTINNPIIKAGDSLIVQGRLLNKLRLKNFKDSIDLLSSKVVFESGFDSLYYFKLPKDINTGIYNVYSINDNILSSNNFLIRVYSLNLDSVKIIGWGFNGTGQLNVPAGLDSEIVSLAMGEYHTLALRVDGSVVAWGAGKTNTGTDPNYGQSIIPIGLEKVVEITAGRYHSLALKCDGTVVAWGAGTTNTGYVPHVGQSMVPSNLFNAISIAAGDAHSLALKSDGSVEAWGFGGDGQTSVPNNLDSVIMIDAGSSYSVALKSDSTVTVFGGTSNQTTIPNGLKNVISIAAGEGHILALKSDSNVVAWGNNGYGQATIPSTLNRIVAIAAGAYHSLFLNSEDSIIALGRNLDGQTIVPANVQEIKEIFTRSTSRSNLAQYNYLLNFSVYTTANSAGKISPSSFVKKNGAYRVTYQANDSYVVDSVFINGIYNEKISQDSLYGYTFYKVTGDSNIRVVFSRLFIKTFAENGYIQPSILIFKKGDSIRITYNNKGLNNSLDSIVVNGQNLGTDSISGFSFNNINSNQTLKVYYSPTTVVIDEATTFNAFNSTFSSNVEQDNVGPNVFGLTYNPKLPNLIEFDMEYYNGKLTYISFASNTNVGSQYVNVLKKFGNKIFFIRDGILGATITLNSDTWIDGTTGALNQNVSIDNLNFLLDNISYFGGQLEPSSNETEGVILFGAPNSFNVAPSDFITLPQMDLKNTDFTVETWIFPKLLSNKFIPVLHFSDPSGLYSQLKIYLNQDSLEIENQNKINNNKYSISIPRLTTQQWQHLALVVKDSRGVIYFNGDSLVNLPELIIDSLALNCQLLKFNEELDSITGSPLKLFNFRIWKTAFNSVDISSIYYTLNPNFDILNSSEIYLNLPLTKLSYQSQDIPQNTLLTNQIESNVSTPLAGNIFINSFSPATYSTQNYHTIYGRLSSNFPVLPNEKIQYGTIIGNDTSWNNIDTAIGFNLKLTIPQLKQPAKIIFRSSLNIRHFTQNLDFYLVNTKAINGVINDSPIVLNNTETKINFYPLEYFDVLDRLIINDVYIPELSYKSNTSYFFPTITGDSSIEVVFKVDSFLYDRSKIVSIVSLSPATALPNTELTIKGRNFSADSLKVFIGNIKAKVISVNDSTIVVLTPTAAAYGQVTVSNKGQVAVSTSYFTPLNFNANTNGRIKLKQKHSFDLLENSIINYSQNPAFSTTVTPLNYPDLKLLDYNNDGWADYLFSNDHNITILSTNPSFAEKITKATSSSEIPISYQIKNYTNCIKPIIADFNGDGLLDNIFQSPNGFQIFINNSTIDQINLNYQSTYFKEDSLPNYSQVNWQAADLDLDGKIDLIVTDSSSNSPSAVFFLKNISTYDSIKFADFIRITDPYSSAKTFVIEDIDNDYFPDLILCLPNTVLVFRNISFYNHYLTFAKPKTYYNSTNMQNIYKTSLDGNIHKQFYIHSYTSNNSLTLLVNNSEKGSVYSSSTSHINAVDFGQTTLAYTPQSCEFYDLNGDGKPDNLINYRNEISSRNSIQDFDLIKNLFHYNITAPLLIDTNFSLPNKIGNSFIQNVLINDYNHDNIPDIIYIYFDQDSQSLRSYYWLGQQYLFFDSTNNYEIRDDSLLTFKFNYKKDLIQSQDFTLNNKIIITISNQDGNFSQPLYIDSLVNFNKDTGSFKIKLPFFYQNSPLLMRLISTSPQLISDNKIIQVNIKSQVDSFDHYFVKPKDTLKIYGNNFNTNTDSLTIILSSAEYKTVVLKPFYLSSNLIKIILPSQLKNTLYAIQIKNAPTLDFFSYNLVRPYSDSLLVLDQNQNYTNYKQNFPEGLTNIISLEKFEDKNGVLLQDGTLRFWGKTIGFNNQSTLVIPDSIYKKKIVDFKLGRYNAAVLYTDGTINFWGYFKHPQYLPDQNERINFDSAANLLNPNSTINIIKLGIDQYGVFGLNSLKQLVYWTLDSSVYQSLYNWTKDKEIIDFKILNKYGFLLNKDSIIGYHTILQPNNFKTTAFQSNYNKIINFNLFLNTINDQNYSFDYRNIIVYDTGNKFEYFQYFLNTSSYTFFGTPLDLPKNFSNKITNIFADTNYLLYYYQDSFIHIRREDAFIADTIPSGFRRIADPKSGSELPVILYKPIYITQLNYFKDLNSIDYEIFNIQKYNLEYGQNLKINYSLPDSTALDSIFINNRKINDSFLNYSFKNIISDSVIKIFYSRKYLEVIVIDSTTGEKILDSLVAYNQNLVLPLKNPNYKIDSLLINDIKVPIIDTFKMDSIRQKIIIKLFRSKLTNLRFILKTFNNEHFLDSVLLSNDTFKILRNTPLTYGQKLDSIFSNDRQIQIIYTNDTIYLTDFHLLYDTITLFFNPKLFQLNYSVLGKGNIELTPNMNRLSIFDTIHISANPVNDSWYLDSIFINNSYYPQGDSNFSYFLKDTQDVNFVFQFDSIPANKFLIHIISTANGWVYPSKNIFVSAGDSFRFYIFPDAGYADSFSINGIILNDSIQAYTINNIQENKEVNVSFYPKTDIKIVKLKVLVEGYLTNNGTMVSKLFNSFEAGCKNCLPVPNFADSITIIVNDSEGQNLYSYKNLLNIDGSTYLEIPTNLLNDYYYLQINLNGAVPIWSASPLNLSLSQQYFDFTDSNNVFEKNISFNSSNNNGAMYSGLVFPALETEISLDGIIYTNQNIENYMQGYGVTDLNGDGYVTIDDALLIIKNFKKIILIKKPFQ